MVTKIEKTFRAKEIALAAFLDIEGAFDNASHSSIAIAMNKRDFHGSIVDWISAMLKNRNVTARLGDATITVKTTKGCPQGGVLSPLLWSLIVDDLLDSLEALGFEIIGFADNIVIITRGKHGQILSSKMQTALN